MLRTGEVAALLGTSRQHVVDLCDRAALPSVRVGSHRRIPREAVERLVRPSLTREQERSLWLHRALVAPLLSDPNAVLLHARTNVARWQPEQRADGMAARYLDRWTTLLDGGVDQVVDVLISARPEACELRQNSPFAGVLPEDTRQAVLRSFAEHWSREHEGSLP